MSLSEQLTFTSPLIEETPVSVDEVPTEYTVVLGYHGRPADFPGRLRDLYQSADVVLHEQLGWHDKEKTIYNRLSKANEQRQSEIIEMARPLYFNHPLAMHRLQLVAGTGAQHGFWDIPAGHPVLATQIRGRRLDARTPTESKLFADAVIEADQLALMSLKKRIPLVPRRSMKHELRRVIIHAGMSHVLLYNALRLRAEVDGRSTVALHIPFQNERQDLRLEDQLPEIISTVAFVRGQQPDTAFYKQVEAFHQIEKSLALKAETAHESAHNIWQRIRNDQ